MNNLFKATYSTLSTTSLLEMVIHDYNNIDFVECRLLNTGLNDTYLLRTKNNDRYILRVYRTGWRTLSDIMYELSVLLHLHKKGLNISVPLPRKDNELIYPVKAIEGTRYIVLFTYAPGKEVDCKDDKVAINYGRTVAEIHNATDDFKTRHIRFPLDLNHLLESPMKALEPQLSYRVQDWEYIKKLYKLLTSALHNLPIDLLEQGFCHGDFHGWNANISKDNIITFYDFDCCGYGWRAYDLAVFRWGAMLRDKEKEQWKYFLEGYNEKKILKDTDLRAIPLFIGIRQIWFLGLHAANAFDIGSGHLNDNYYDQQINFLKKWEQEYLLDIEKI